MAAIPLPERGQPLDVNYIYDMVSQINSITNTIAIRSTSTSKVNENSDTTSNLKFFAVNVKINTTNASSNSSESFDIQYDQFRFLPVVVATLVNNSGSAAGNNAIVTLNTIRNSRCKGVVRFNTPGAVDLSVNILAIGVV